MAQQHLPPMVSLAMRKINNNNVVQIDRFECESCGRGFPLVHDSGMTACSFKDPAQVR